MSPEKKSVAKRSPSAPHEAIDLTRHLESQGCQRMREGRQHSLLHQPPTRNPPPCRVIEKFQGTVRSIAGLSEIRRRSEPPRAKLNRRLVQWLSTFKLKRRHQ